MEARHLSQLLEQAAAKRPDHTALEDEHGRRLSYAELLRGADRVATRLARWGVEPRRSSRQSGFPRASKPSSRFTAFCGRVRRMCRSIPRGRRFARQRSWPRAASRPRWLPPRWRPRSAPRGPAAGPLPRLIVVEADDCDDRPAAGLDRRPICHACGVPSDACWSEVFGR